MPPQNNPAGRLYAIISRFREVPSADGKAIRDLKHAWAFTLELDSPDEEELLAGVREVMTLIEDVKKNIMLLDDVDHRLYMQPFINIQKLFVLGLSSMDYPTALKIVDVGTMRELHHAAILLSEKQPEMMIKSEELSELRSSVSELINELENMILPEDLKRLIQINLRNILNAIDYYFLHGTPGIKEAVDRAFGSMWIYGYQNPEEPDEASSKTIRDYLTLLLRALSMVADVDGLISLGERAYEVFLP